MTDRINILLISPGNLSQQQNESGRDVVYSPNFGLIYVANFAEKHFGDRINIEICEPVAEGLSFEDLENKISVVKPNIIGISSKTFNIRGAFRVGEIAKNLNDDILIILGGAHPTALPEYTLEECEYIDIIVRGEGELTFNAIIENYIAGKNRYNEIDGITYKDGNGKFVTNPNMKLIENLDDLGVLTYEKHDMRNFSFGYNPITNQKGNYLGMFASRGCPYRCSFCMPLLTRRVRRRSPQKVISEMEYLVDEMRAEFIYFEDSCMATDKKWFINICELIITNTFHEKCSWGFETRVETVNVDMLRIAVKSGCMYINFGLESGCDKILDRNNKQFKTKDAVRAIKIAREAGVKLLHGSFILGLPYESKKTIEETLNFISKIELDMIAINVVNIYPGTELYEMVENGIGGIRWIEGFRNNWGKYERSDCQTEVNDLSAKEIRFYYNKALNVVERKTRRRFTI